MPNRADFLYTFFVGREAELMELHDFFSTAINGQQPMFVLVQGDVGVGKTSLVEHFLAKIQRPNDQNLIPFIGRAKCAMESEGSGLIPFSQLLSSLLVDEGAQAYFKSWDASEFLKETAPAWLDILSLGTASRMRTSGGKTPEADRGASGHTVDFAGGVSRSGGIDINSKSVQVSGDVVGRDKINANTTNITNIYGQSRNSYKQDQVFIQFANALSRLAEKQIIVAFIDDLQWADASSLRLLFHLSRNLHDVPILFICTCGPAVALSANPNATLFREICAELVHRGAETVEILNGLDVAHYAAQRYSPNSFGRDFLARVQKLTDGHAQFVSELFSMWEKEKVIALASSLDSQPVWAIARDPYFPDVPTSLKPLLDLRIESLTKELQDVLNLASVEGIDFAAEVVAKLRSADELETYGQLEILERDYRFIQVQGDPELTAMSLSFYRFVNRFFRERVYSRLIPAKQRVLHKKVGECLEILYNDRQPIAGQLADHFFKANEVLKAVSYSLMAAQFEQSRYAWYEAEVRCRNGLEWLKLNESIGNSDIGKQLKFDLLECSANGLFCSSQYALAGERYTAALSIVASLQVEANRIADLYCRLADVHYYEGHTQQAIRACATGKQILLSADVPFNAIHIELDALSAFMQSQLGHTAAAEVSIRGILDRAERLPRSNNLEEACGDAYNSLGVILAQLGRYSESQTAYARAIEIAEKIGKQQLAEMAILNTADNFVDIGLIDQAVDYTERGLRLAQRIGDLDGIDNAQSTQCEIFLARGNPHEAISQLLQAMGRAQEIGSAWNTPYLCVILTKAYLMANDVDSARRYAMQGVTSAQDAGQFELGLALDALGQAEKAASNWTMADQHFNQSMTIHRQADHHADLARVQRHYADSLLRQGSKSEAADLLRTALATFNELDLPDEATQTQQLLNTFAAS